jgi:hypothetical protein
VVAKVVAVIAIVIAEVIAKEDVINQNTIIHKKK